jgi:hypothetical protein
MFSAKFNFIKQNSAVSALPNKTQLLTMDYAYNAQPFIVVVSKDQNTYNLDIAYNAQPFVGTK